MKIRTLMTLAIGVVALSAARCSDTVTHPVYEYDYADWGGDGPGALDVAGGDADTSGPGPDDVDDDARTDGGIDDPGGPQPDGATTPDDGGSTPDPGGSDLPLDEGPTVDLDKPILRSAFYNSNGNAGVVTARFSEPIATGAETLANYGIKASNGQALAISGATQRTDALQYVDLTVNAAEINPALTYTLTVRNVMDAAGNEIPVGQNKARINRTLYLNIIWHQHQPLYLDPVADQLSGPWVRKHATKDYYDMTAILEGYPDVHVNVNLTSVMLRQLIEYYLDRLDPFVDVYANTMDVEGFKAAWGGHTDPWIDFLLEETPTAETITDEELLLVWKGPWTLVSTADATMRHFPEYIALRDANRAEYDHDDFLALKIWFEIAWFDPDFLDGPVELPDGSVTRVHEWLDRSGDEYTLNVPYSEELAVDLLIEEDKIMRNVIPIHQKLFYDVAGGTGQVEVTTTPMYHPILPLIYDTELMAQSQPFDARPDPPFSYPQDAEAQVLRSVRFYEDVFGVKPRGIWCGEGAVAEAIVPLLVDAGFEWTATGEGVLHRSLDDEEAPVYQAYRVDSDTVVGHGGDASDSMVIVFRHEDLSDRMGFKYKTWYGVDAAEDFVNDVAAYAPGLGGPDRILTVILDGENAWESYVHEQDGKGFLRALYTKLSEAYETAEIVTVTTSEFIHGNPSRAVAPHPIAEQTELEPLWAGSWIGATFSTWIGEQEENKAWEYLRQARADLAAADLPRPNPLSDEPAGETGWVHDVWKAWDLMYAAEGSDWFWWYGVDQITPSNDDSPFDRAFRSQLLGMYGKVNAALEKLGRSTFLVPDFAPLIQAKPKGLEGPWDGEELAPPVINGYFEPNESEWTPPGAFFFDSDSSTAISATDDISTVYYGYDAEAFYVAVVTNEVLSAKEQTPYSISVLFDHKTILDAELGTFSQDPANDFVPPGETFVGLKVARRLRADFSKSPVVLRLEEADGSGGWNEVQSHGATLGGPIFGATLLELRVPFADLNLQGPSDPLNFYVVATEGDEDIDAAPSLNAKRVFDDVTNLVFVTFIADCTGSEIPLDSLPLDMKPAPAGQGLVYIVGNQDKLGDWVPNKIALSDSGKQGDETAGDGLWTGIFGFARGDVVQYKYTVGTGTDEGQWPGTEEFPFTNRQYVIPTDPGVTKVVLRDVLGDDPPQENSLGKLTTVEELDE